MLGPILLGSLLALLALLAWSDWLARRLLFPPREPVTRTPTDCGLVYEEVSFESADGLKLKGWWIPAQGAATESARVVVLLHPFLGNRQGSASGRGPAQGLAGPEVDLLQLAVSFHQAHYAVLLVDLRSHGESERGLCAGGPTEDQDVAGAVNYAFDRAGGEAPWVGLMGFGLGANAALAAVGRYKGGTEKTWIFSGDSEGGSDWTEIQPANIKRLSFVVAVRPAALGRVVERQMRARLGPAGRLLLPLLSQLCQWHGGYPLDPGALRKFAGGVTVPVLYVQARDDRWADGAETLALYDATPARKQIWWMETAGGEAGYAQIGTRLERVLSFAEAAADPAAVSAGGRTGPD
jgi:pimeloyl-ACP methyl ester carboxylesterase